jgi:hypothetical protein
MTKSSNRNIRDYIIFLVIRSLHEHFAGVMRKYLLYYFLISEKKIKLTKKEQLLMTSSSQAVTNMFRLSLPYQKIWSAQ